MFSTTAAVPSGRCHKCGGQLYENLFHHCGSTSVRYMPQVSSGFEWHHPAQPVREEDLPDTLTVPEAAKRLGVSADLLYRLIREGKSPVKPIPLGRRLVISRVQLERILDGDTNGGTDQ